MGGSGGSYFGAGELDSIRQQVQDAQKRATDPEYLSQCNEFLGSLLADFNDRDTEAIRQHLQEIAVALDKELEGSIDIVFGGSVSKNTYVEGLSDIDALVMLDSCELADRRPLEAKQHFAERLRERFPSSQVTEGNLTVTIAFADSEIQLLPAVSCRGAVKISEPDGTDWARIQPREFTKALTARNDEAGKKLVPTIKLAKAVIGLLPEQQRISGYHAESLAVDVFRGYSGPYSYKDMLKHFFQHSSQRVLEPLHDRTGQSIHVDEKLGDSQSVARRIVADAFGRVARRMSNADAAGRLEDWRLLFGQS